MSSATEAPTQRLERALAALEQLPQSAAREASRDAIGAVLELHASALARLLEVSRDHTNGAALLEAFAADADVANMLLLHGLHPVDLEARLATGLGKLDSYLRLNLARLELVALSSAGVKLRLTQAAVGCGSTGAKVRARIEEVLAGVAPEVSVEIEEAQAPTQGSGFVPLSRLHKAPADDRGEPA